MCLAKCFFKNLQAAIIKNQSTGISAVTNLKFSQVAKDNSSMAMPLTRELFRQAEGAVIRKARLRQVPGFHKRIAQQI